MVSGNLEISLSFRDKKTDLHFMIYLFIRVRVNLRIQPNPVKTGRKLNVYKMFGRRPGRLLRLLNVLCMFNLRSVSTGERGEIRT